MCIGEYLCSRILEFYSYEEAWRSFRFCFIAIYTCICEKKLRPREGRSLTQGHTADYHVFCDSVLCHFDICVALVSFPTAELVASKNKNCPWMVPWAFPYLTPILMQYLILFWPEESSRSIGSGKIWDISFPTIASWPCWHGLAGTSLFAWQPLPHLLFSTHSPHA